MTRRARPRARPRARLLPRSLTYRWRRYRTPPGHVGVQLTRWPSGWYLQLGRALWTTDREVGS